MRLLRACLVIIFENCSKKQEEQRKYGEYGLVSLFYCFEKHKEYITNLFQRTKTVFREHQNGVLCIFKYYSQEKFSKEETIRILYLFIYFFIIKIGA